MNHIDEHILELYVLGDRRAVTRRREIEAHLKACAGCRAIAREWDEFYKEVQEERKRSIEAGDSLSPVKALVRRPSGELTLLDDHALPVEVIQERPLRRLSFFVRQHPVSMGATGFSVLFTLLAAVFLLRGSGSDINPSYTYLNAAQGYFEVYNARNEKLWQIPCADLVASRNLEERQNISLSKVLDLDGDRRNEVVAAVPRLGANVNARNILYIFSSDKKRDQQIPLGGPSTFAGRQYGGLDFASHGLLVEDFANSGSKEIIVSAANIRSPSVVERFDASGKLLGEYWHFGTLYSLHAVDMNSDGKKELLLCGVNDAADSTDDDFGSIVVLDPTKITGKTESRCTRGFGLPPSEAELYYVRLPESDIEQALHLKTGATNIMEQHLPSGRTLKFHVNGPPPDDLPTFEYIFSIDFRLLLVKSDDRTKQMRYELVEKGKLSEVDQEKYFQDLAKKVEFWDGEKWQRQRVLMNH